MKGNNANAVNTVGTDWVCDDAGDSMSVVTVRKEPTFFVGSGRFLFEAEVDMDDGSTAFIIGVEGMDETDTAFDMFVCEESGEAVERIGFVSETLLRTATNYVLESPCDIQSGEMWDYTVEIDAERLDVVETAYSAWDTKADWLGEVHADALREWSDVKRSRLHESAREAWNVLKPLVHDCGEIETFAQTTDETESVKQEWVENDGGSVLELEREVARTIC